MAEGGDTPPGRGPGDPIDLPPPRFRRRRVVQSGATHLMIGFGPAEGDSPDYDHAEVFVDRPGYQEEWKP